MAEGPAAINEAALRAAKRLGADDVASLVVTADEEMVAFANDSLSAAKSSNATVLRLCIGYKKRRIVGSSSNVEEDDVKIFVDKLFASLKTLSAQKDYAQLPAKKRRFSPSRSAYDKKLGALEAELPELASQAIDAASDAGAKRSAGSVTASLATHYLLTSGGAEGSDTSSSILLNIRSFTEDNASGHGLSCSSGLRGFDPVEAGRTAGQHAKAMANPKQPKAGEYQVLMGPTVASNLLSLVGDFASAFSIDSGTSYLAGKRLGDRVASELMTIKDHGYIEGCLDGRSFDSEGLPTGTTTIIGEGLLKSYLHNLTTAKKFKTKSTANAGWVHPGSWNLEVSAGDATYDEMVKGMKKGIILTSNWYTRFTNYRSGEFSTVPRDGAYLVEEGKVKAPLHGLRIGDSMERMCNSAVMLSKERKWIQWWEVDTPTLCPWVLVDGVKVTRAFG